VVVEGTPLAILAQTAYPPAVASARVRIAAQVRPLAAHGVALDYDPTLTDREYRMLSSEGPAARKLGVLIASAIRLAAKRREHEDLLLVHRLRLLAPLPGTDPPRALDAYDFDDALYLGSTGPTNRRFAWVKQEARRSVTCLRRARLVLAGNPILAGVARQYARRVEVVPSCVDVRRQPLHVHGPAETVTVGWLGSPTTSRYLAPVLAALGSLNEPRPRARLVIVGADTGARASWIEHRPWSLEGEPGHLARFDIGIMPLPDTAWTRGKCAYKLLQYFAAGVPAVSSPVGVARELIGAERGLLASTVQTWQEALARLIADPDERRERGARARAFVEREYSYERWAPELAAMLRSLAR
jgi:glycosyltransferase involved in cell wall biosynthesis